MPLSGAVVDELLDSLVITLLRPPHHLSDLFGSQFGDTKLFHLVLVVEVDLPRVVLFQEHLLTVLVSLILLVDVFQFVLSSLTPYLIEQYRTILSQLLRKRGNHVLQFLDIIMNNVIEQLRGLICAVSRQRFVEVVNHRLAELCPIVLSTRNRLTDVSQCIVHADCHAVHQFLLEFRIHARLCRHFRDGSNLTLVVIFDVIDNRLSLALFLSHFLTERLATSCLFRLTVTFCLLIGCIVIKSTRRLVFGGGNEIVFKRLPLFVDAVHGVGSRISLRSITSGSIKHPFSLSEGAGVVGTDLIWCKCTFRTAIHSHVANIAMHIEPFRR